MPRFLGPKRQGERYAQLLASAASLDASFALSTLCRVTATDQRLSLRLRDDSCIQDLASVPSWGR